MQILAVTHLKPNGFADWKRVWSALERMGWKYNETTKRAIQIRRADLLRRHGGNHGNDGAKSSLTFGKSGGRQRSSFSPGSSSLSSLSSSTSPSCSSSSFSSPLKLRRENVRQRTYSMNDAVVVRNRVRSSSHTKEDESDIAVLLASGMSGNASPRHSFSSSVGSEIAVNLLQQHVALASLTPVQSQCRERGYISVPTDYKSVNVAVHMAIEISVYEIRICRGVHIVETTDTDGIPIRTLHVNVPLRFVGEGIQQTVIKGGITIGGSPNHSLLAVEFHQMTLTNPDHVGIDNDGGLSVLLEDCEVTECRTIGIHVRNGVQLTMRRSIVHHNGTSGIYCAGQLTMGRVIDCKSYNNLGSGVVAVLGSRIDVYGESTEIYENGNGGEGFGMKVCKQGSEIYFHVPNHQRLVHDNAGQRNFKETKGGRIINVNEMVVNNNNYTMLNNDMLNLEKQSRELVAQVLVKSRSNSMSEIIKK